jgi:hypothetical protein
MCEQRCETILSLDVQDGHAHPRAALLAGPVIFPIYKAPANALHTSGPRRHVSAGYQLPTDCSTVRSVAIPGSTHLPLYGSPFYWALVIRQNFRQTFKVDG